MAKDAHGQFRKLLRFISKHNPRHARNIRNQEPRAPTIGRMNGEGAEASVCGLTLFSVETQNSVNETL
jgi:hypothetical protein